MLCLDWVVVGQGLVCVKVCFMQVIVFGIKEDMLIYVEVWVEDLKLCGYDKVGIYDFVGVGGMYVFYVLYYVDKLVLYFDLLEELWIFLVVEGWKGVIKIVGFVVIGVVVFGLVLYGFLGCVNKVIVVEEYEVEELVECSEREV